CALLHPRRVELAERMWGRIAVMRPDEERLLPVACILAQCAAEDERWLPVRRPVAEILVRQNPLLAAQWLPGFRPAAAQLIAPLAELCASERAEPAMSNAA